MNKIRIDSGSINGTSLLQAFFYDVLRDCCCAGVIELAIKFVESGEYVRNKNYINFVSDDVLEVAQTLCRVIGNYSTYENLVIFFYKMIEFGADFAQITTIANDQ